jgi:mRNA-degrading endonuclease RelE of RelBE toxin-antitoxin system
MMSMALKDPDLANNGAFWEDYAKLSAKGGDGEKQMQALIEKYKPGATAQSEASAATKPSSVSAQTEKPAAGVSNTYNVQHKAEKEIKKLPKDLQENVDEFLEIASRPGGFKEIQNNPGKWRYEQVEQFGKDAHTVRINGGYRILFDLDKKTHHMEIRMVNKDKIHGG